MKSIAKRNPLSYFGWLGLIGIVGINTGDWELQLFLFYFFFFGYRNMTPDELFWGNVKRAGTISFLFLFVVNQILTVLIVIFENVGTTWEQVQFLIRSFFISSFLSAFIFMGILMYFKHQEKKSMEADHA